MVLTPEQRERMERNRQRALETKRKKQTENENTPSRNASSGAGEFEAGGFVRGAEPQNKKRKSEAATKDAAGTGKGDSKGCTEIDQGTCVGSNDESSLEDFEHNASTHISQAEAKRVYCIPPGTLAVCSYIEKDNPHRRGWAKMKLYSRSDVRRRARKRFGGKGGLAAERERRKKKRFEKDLKETEDVFS